MELSYYKSPIGILEIICQNDELISLKLVDKEQLPTVETNFIKNIQHQLDEYFSGIRKSFDIKTNPKGTAFQKLVWKELLKIPYGMTKSYSEIAENIGNRKAQRAVGSTCNKNPIMIIIPCHRVVSKNGELGGFAYEKTVKQNLLNLENNILNICQNF